MKRGSETSAQPTQIVLEQAASSDALHPLLQNLEIRLLAAEGGLEEALREVAEQRTAADADGLRTVLAELHEALWRTNLPSDVQTRLVGYALGFGQAPNDLAGLPSETRAVFDALRAYESNAPVDLAALEPQGAKCRQIPRFIELAKAKAQLRRFDEQLRSLALSKTSR